MLDAVLDCLRAMKNDLECLEIKDVTLTGNTPLETCLLFEALASLPHLCALGVCFKDGALDDPAVAQALAALLAARELVLVDDEIDMPPNERWWWQVDL